jgi:dTDP-4-dehydrorhamnose reductase
MSFSSFELLNHSKPILVFGCDGQLCKALQVCLKDLKIPVVFLGCDECDLVNEDAIRQVLNRYQPQVIINAATYTALDKAENERDFAFAINAEAPQVMAHYIANVAHGVLAHYSTDYVFADSKTIGYIETDSVVPADQLCIYGQSKLVGEQAIEEAFNLAHDSGHDKYQDRFSKYFILRTSWVNGDGSNFIRIMLRLAGEREQLKVAADQIGAPISAQWLAQVGAQMAGSRVESGIYHAIPDCEISWHGLVVFAIETSATAGEGIELKSENILSIPAIDYLLSAKRPYNFCLSNVKLKKSLSEIDFTEQYPHWQKQVKAYVKKICNSFFEELNEFLLIKLS